jgi:CIC family chloride channel protein
MGLPMLDANGRLVGVVTLRDLTDSTLDANAPIRAAIKRLPAVMFEDNTLREAVDPMLEERVGCLAVVWREDPSRLVGLVSRSDLLEAHRSRHDARTRASRVSDLRTAAQPAGERSRNRETAPPTRRT